MILWLGKDGSKRRLFENVLSPPSKDVLSGSYYDDNHEGSPVFGHSQMQERVQHRTIDRFVDIPVPETREERDFGGQICMII